MSYKQNNPFSRKSSPLNKDDRWIQKATESIKERGTEGVCTGDKFGSESCPPGSKRYNLAKTFKAMAKKGGPSRESSEEEYMPIEDDMHRGMSRKSSSPLNDRKRRGGKNIVHSHITNKEYKDTRDKFVNEPIDKAEQIYQEGQREKNERSGEEDNGTSRRSSSPLNQDERSDFEKAIIQDQLEYDASGRDAELEKLGFEGPYDERSGFEKAIIQDQKEYDASGRDAELEKLGFEGPYEYDEKMGPRRESSSPLNNTGITGLNYSKELQYMPIEDDMHRGMSRESSSPLHGTGSRKSHIGTPPHYRDGLKPAEWSTHFKNSGHHGPKSKNEEESSSPLNHAGRPHIHTAAGDKARARIRRTQKEIIKKNSKPLAGTSRKSSSPLDAKDPQKKHDRRVKRVTRKIKKGKYDAVERKLEKFGPEVVMDAFHASDKN